MDIEELKIDIRDAIKDVNLLFNNIFKLNSEQILDILMRINDYVKKFNDTDLTKEFDTLYSVVAEGGTGNIRKQLETFKAKLLGFLNKKEEELPVTYDAIYKLYINKKISAFECANRIDTLCKKILKVTYKKGITHKVITGIGELNVPDLKGEFDHDFIEDDDLVAVAEAWFAIHNGTSLKDIVLAGSKDFATKHGGITGLLRMLEEKFSAEVSRAKLLRKW